jgi:uncharacterized protein YhhL (DUF1145 family)
LLKLNKSLFLFLGLISLINLKTPIPNPTPIIIHKFFFLLVYFINFKSYIKLWNTYKKIVYKKNLY